MPTGLEVQQLLTAPGAPFELVEDIVGGVPMVVYKHRMASLRVVASLGPARGNEQLYLVYGDRRIGFADSVQAANSVSHQLAAGGVAPGDRVAVLAANNPEWIFTFWGAVDLGAVLVGLNGWWKADEILYGLADSQARVLVADRDRFSRVADRLGELHCLEAVYLIDADPGEFGDDSRLHRFDELLATPTDAMPTTDIHEDAPAVIFYTSGTTGRPKGAISTHRSMVANLQNTFYHHLSGTLVRGGDAGLIGGTDRQSVALLTSPLFHVSGCHSGIVVAMAAGVRNVMPVGRFDPLTVLRLIQTEEVTIWATVPTMVARVVEHPGRDHYDLSSVTTVACGGSPLGPQLQQGIRDTFPNVTVFGNAYGLTESSSVATVISGQDLLDRPGSVGRPVPGMQVRIVRADGDDARVGSVGEVWLKGALITPGYWGKPDDTASTVTDGWLHTGDIGYLDDDGFLYITDRAKDMIIRGGENVYCVEIENRLLEHPGIGDAAVIGVPHPVLGEEVKAVISVVPGMKVTEDEVRAWVGQTLADFKIPAYVEIRMEPLPRNATGKLLKNVLRGDGTVSFAETF